MSVDVEKGGDANPQLDVSSRAPAITDSTIAEAVPVAEGTTTDDCGT